MGNLISAVEFKKRCLSTKGKISLGKAIEYSIKEPLGEYRVQEFEDEILLITKDMIFLIKYYEKYHSVEDDAKFLSDFAKKIANNLKDIPPKASLSHIAFNAYDNPNGEEAVEEVFIEIKESE